MIPKPFLDAINLFFARKEAMEQVINKKVFIYGLGYYCYGVVTAWYYEGEHKKYDITYQLKNQTESRFGSFFNHQIHFLE